MGGGRRRTSPWRTAALLLVAVLTAAGTGLVYAGVTAEPPRPPQPGADAAPPAAVLSPDGPPPPEDPQAEPGDGEEPAGIFARRLPTAELQRRAAAAAMRPSVPIRIRIPAIEVDAHVVSLGVDARGEVEVPPLERAMDAGWYRYGPTPGEVGNSVIIGHVDSRNIGTAVFFYLGRLMPGDTIEVLRQDGSVASFRVDGVQAYAKAEFPARLVYGPADWSNLRVVTCGGRFDEQTRSYEANLVVFATLQPDASRPAGRTPPPAPAPAPAASPATAEPGADPEPQETHKGQIWQRKGE